MPPPNPPSVPRSHATPAPAVLRLRPDLADLAALSEYIETVGDENGLSGGDIMAFNLAAEELLANTVRHGEPVASAIEFSLAIHNGFLTATYADDAGLFDPTIAPQADTTLPQERRAIGGLGIHFIRRTMQIFSYRRDGERNVITFGRPAGDASVPPPG
jgi:anti-sigma regulatory factor (Ser/Thr protein kinase)